MRDAKLRPRISTLTPREREILKLLAEGNSVKEIAVFLSKLQRSFDPDQSLDRIDVRMRPDERQQALFTPDARFVVYMSGQGTEPTQVIENHPSSTAERRKSIEQTAPPSPDPGAKD